MIEGAKLPSLGILSIATGEAYVAYWANLARSVSVHVGDLKKVTMHVFTDEPDLARKHAESLRNVTVRIYEIPPYSWPDATLLRYEIFDTHREVFLEDCLLYLDADMLVVRDFSCDSFEQAINRGILLVAHPGYYRTRNVWGRFLFYARNLRHFLNDLKMLVMLGGVGAWETRAKSTAFVPRPLRHSYVCGGCWMGENSKILELIHELAASTRVDTENGVVAKWHDESHLNAAHARFRFGVLSPSWCFAEGYGNLSGLEPVIIAIDKTKPRPQ